jgi:hypothetical protein
MNNLEAHAAPHSEYGVLIRCDIGAKEIERSRD